MALDIWHALGLHHHPQVISWSKSDGVLDSCEVYEPANPRPGQIEGVKADHEGWVRHESEGVHGRAVAAAQGMLDKISLKPRHMKQYPDNI